jgi:YebC/PmpR family DNA-binding regulatory protein
MSGHSKWASIKHKKAAADTQRGKIFTKLIKEITTAARVGGGKPDANPRLRVAIEKAKSSNMPSDNIERAIKKGTGELPGVSYEEITYEGYGPGGVAILVEVMTDNKNRATADIRNIFSKKGGNLAGTGSVNWMFQKKGFMVVNKNQADEEKLMSIVLDNGGEDLSVEDGTFEITTSPKDFENVKKALNDKKINTESAEITMIPTSTVKISDKSQAQQLLALVEALEENDDVQNVYANFDIPDEILKTIEA